MRLGLSLGLTGGGQVAFEPNASLALDFRTNRYRVGTGSQSTPNFASLSGLTVTRASVGYAERVDGSLVLFPTNTARITNKGLLVEEARTNLFLNSFAPVTQTITITAVSHTISVWGTGSVTVAAGTATISNPGAASAGSPRTIGCTVAGTITVTVSGSPTAVNVEAGAFGTSPIPTLGASATRAADLVKLLYTFGPDGYLLVEYTQPVSPLAAGNPRIIGDYGSTLAPLYAESAGTKVGSFNGSVALLTGVISLPANSAVKAILTWDATGRAIAVNGLATISDANGIGALTGVALGSLLPANSTLLNSYLRRVVGGAGRYSAAQMQALTQ